MPFGLERWSPPPGSALGSEPDVASLVRRGRTWTASWRQESGTLPHLKGVADIATLVGHRGQEISALQLASGRVGPVTADAMIDVQALDAYRKRLDELDAEIDEAEDHADLGRSERLEAERQQLLAEIRRSTGLGGRIRSNPNDPAERARKAVSGRIRDAIRRLDEITPELAAHLNRSIHTGLRCSYAPTGDDSHVRWHVET